MPQPTQDTRSAVGSPAKAVPKGDFGWIRGAGYLSLISLALGVVGLGLHNLGNRYFWTDESSSFFTALGWPAPGDPPGGLAAIQQTLVTFLDPGLYHLMIRGWSDLFGTRIETLRALPFTFFVLYVIALLLWYRRFRLPLIVGTAGVSLMMVENITPFYAVEVRAYSASLAAAVVLPLVGLWFLDKPSGRRLAGFLVIGLFLGAMQYMTISVNLATAALLGFGALKRRASGGVRNLIIGAFALASWLPLIYLVTRGWPSGGAEADLNHVRNTVLAYMDAATVINTLTTNFLSFTALPRTLFLLLVPALFVAGKIMEGHPSSVLRERRPDTPIFQLWIYVFALTFSAALVSVGGFLPWVLGTRWSITEIAGIALSILGIIALIRLYAPTALWEKGTVRIVGSLILMLLVTVGAWRLWNYERPGNSQALDELVPVLVSGESDAPILVDYWIYPDTRYWVEYSGQFESWRTDWIDRGVMSTEGYVKAGPDEVLAFLSSPSTRMLLKDDEALETLPEPLPQSVEIVYPSDPDFASPGLSSSPLVLVKTDRSEWFSS